MNLAKFFGPKKGGAEAPVHVWWTCIYVHPHNTRNRSQSHSSPSLTVFRPPRSPITRLSEPMVRRTLPSIQASVFDSASSAVIVSPNPQRWRIICFVSCLRFCCHFSWCFVLHACFLFCKRILLSDCIGVSVVRSIILFLPLKIKVSFVSFKSKILKNFPGGLSAPRTPWRGALALDPAGGVPPPVGRCAASPPDGPLNFGLGTGLGRGDWYPLAWNMYNHVCTSFYSRVEREGTQYYVLAVSLRVINLEAIHIRTTIILYVFPLI